jgi:hypothetical protein
VVHSLVVVTNAADLAVNNWLTAQLVAAWRALSLTSFHGPCSSITT